MEKIPQKILNKIDILQRKKEDTSNIFPCFTIDPEKLNEVVEILANKNLEKKIKEQNMLGNNIK